MATIINNPTKTISDEGMGFGLVMGILITILIAFLFFVYGLPVLQSTIEEKQPAVQKIEIKLPTPTAPQATPAE